MRKMTETTERDHYEKLQSQLQEVPWILNGSVMKIAPRTDSPHANTTYTWTRKIKAKTVTVALSKQQYEAFHEAIAANRRAEKALAQMRRHSERVLMNSLPGVKKKPRPKRGETGSTIQG
jgi:hypothetical protein